MQEFLTKIDVFNPHKTLRVLSGFIVGFGLCSGFTSKVGLGFGFQKVGAGSGFCWVFRNPFRHQLNCTLQYMYSLSVTLLQVGTVSSEDPHGHMSLFLHHQHEQQTQHFQRHPVAFDLKNGGPVHFGFRSLSSDARTGPKSSNLNAATTTTTTTTVSTLFAGPEDDPPLLMSSIDGGVSTQVCNILLLM